MEKPIKLSEKYERNGWPSLRRPDIKPPEGWSLSLVTSVERIRNHRLSPDGETIAFIKDGETQSDVFTLPLSGGWPARISTNRDLVAYWDDEIPQWSPDGRWLSYTAEGHIQVVPVKSGFPRKITDFTQNAFAPKWMPDSIGLIAGITRNDADQLILTDRDGNWPRALTNKADGDHWDANPAPDGKSLAFVFRPFNDLNRTDICLINLADGEIHTIYGKPKIRAWMPRWSPGGKWLAFISQEEGWDELWLLKADGNGLHKVTHLSADISDVEWSPDGNRIACTVNHDGAFNIYLLELESEAMSLLQGGLGYYTHPQWTPDGKSLTFEHESPIQPPDIFQVELSSKKVKQLTFSNPPALQNNDMIMPENICYESFDGLEIPAFLFKPKTSNGAAILHPHGGPSSLYAAEWDILAQYLVAKGYTFLAPNYRGSTGFGVGFEHANYFDWGKGDTQDCLFGAKFLHTLPGVDASRIGIMGGSYGGYLAICSLARDPEYLFACGISKYGDSNLISSWAQCKRELRLYTEVFLGNPVRNRKIYIDGSPILDVEKVKKPMLILHGLLDDVVPPEASEEWVEAMRLHNKTFEYKTYRNEPHGFLRRENQLDAYARVEQFLDWYLMV